MHGRFTGNAPEHFKPTFHEYRLNDPLHWRKPRRVFTDIMSDLFHEAFTDEQIRDVIDVAIRAPQHVYIVLTKRPERMASLMRWYYQQTKDLLPNLWLGVTVEDQGHDYRIRELLATPAAVRWLSLEPMLGPVKLDLPFGHCPEHDFPGGFCVDRYHHGVRHIDWVVVGAETGPGARVMEPQWAKAVFDQCRAAGVPFWWKSGTPGVLYDAEMTTTRELP